MYSRLYADRQHDVDAHRISETRPFQCAEEKKRRDRAMRKKNYKIKLCIGVFSSNIHMYVICLVFFFKSCILDII